MAKKDLQHHIGHVFSALNFSFQGLKTAALTETAFMQEILLLIAVPVAAFFYGVPAKIILIIVAGWLLVMALELVNMAIESVCNLVSPDFNPLVKIAKDTGSAAVFLVMIPNYIFWVYLTVTYW